MLIRPPLIVIMFVRTIPSSLAPFGDSRPEPPPLHEAAPAKTVNVAGALVEAEQASVTAHVICAPLSARPGESVSVEESVPTLVLPFFH